MGWAWVVWALLGWEWLGTGWPGWRQREKEGNRAWNRTPSSRKAKYSSHGVSSGFKRASGWRTLARGEWGSVARPGLMGGREGNAIRRPKGTDAINAPLVLGAGMPFGITLTGCLFPIGADRFIHPQERLPSA